MNYVKVFSICLLNPGPGPISYVFTLRYFNSALNIVNASFYFFYSNIKNACSVERVFVKRHHTISIRQFKVGKD